MGDYSELLFYQKARQVVIGINTLVKGWPQTVQAREIPRQLFRSATSIGANIAEGYGRHEGIEYIHYLIIAQASANETDHWLHTALDLGLETKESIQPMVKLNNEVRRMLSASISTLKSKKNEHKVREEIAPYNDSDSGPSYE